METSMRMKMKMMMIKTKVCLFLVDSAYQMRPLPAGYPMQNDWKSSAMLDFFHLSSENRYACFLEG